MVSWYKHDIPAWMDGTANLSGDAYRAYHIICQMIYLAEEPIALNERYLAGACNQSVRAFRSAFAELISLKKITSESGKISNSRVAAEIFRVEKNRENARKGGERSGEVREINKNINKNNAGNEASLQQCRSLLDETRLDETRREKTKEESSANAGSSKYAFHDGVIRLNQRDFDGWQKAFGNLDLAAELLSLSQWAGTYGKDWFHPVKGALAKRNREVKARREAPIFEEVSRRVDGRL